MSIIAKKSENELNFEIIPAGTYAAACYGVWDIGLQTTVWNGEEKKQHKVIISWEIDKLIETEGEYKGKRYVISNRYTLSLSNKAILRAQLESWRGKPFTDNELDGFDIEKLIGVNCLINIVHKEKKGKTYANVSTVMKCTNDMKKMKPENDNTPPEWIKKLQKKGSQVIETVKSVFPESEDFDIPDEELNALENGKEEVPF